MLNEDAFSVATKINRMIVKIRSEDTTKIDIARDLINRHIDVDYIYNKAMIWNGDIGFNYDGLNGVKKTVFERYRGH